MTLAMLHRVSIPLEHTPLTGNHVLHIKGSQAAKVPRPLSSLLPLRSLVNLQVLNRAMGVILIALLILTKLNLLVGNLSSSMPLEQILT